jgi:hypothetical protein
MDAKEEAAARARAVVRRFLTRHADALQPPTRGNGVYTFNPVPSAESVALYERWIENTIVNVHRYNYKSNHEFLCALAAEFVARGVGLPPDLQKYMAVDAPRFKRKRGRPRWGGCFADVAIAAAVTLASQIDGLNRTRNRSRDRNHRRTADAAVTASTIVVEVLRQFGITKTEAAVEKIWEKNRFTAYSVYFSRHRPPLASELKLPI